MFRCQHDDILPFSSFRPHRLKKFNEILTIQVKWLYFCFIFSVMFTKLLIVLVLDTFNTVQKIHYFCNLIERLLKLLIIGLISLYVYL